MATTPTPSPTVGAASAVGGLLDAYASSQYQRAAAIQQQTAYLVQARDTMAMAQVRADMDSTYAAVQMGRTLQRAEADSRNWKIAGNTLLKNMRQTNAAIRARAAASGVVLGEGSIQQVMDQNVAATLRDVAVTDLNALTAQVMGFEDATGLIQSTELQNTLNLFQAQRGAGQLTGAATSARATGGMLANQTLVRGVSNFIKADPFAGGGAEPAPYSLDSFYSGHGTSGD
jgi:hypothetical protein